MGQGVKDFLALFFIFNRPETSSVMDEKFEDSHEILSLPLKN